MKKAFIVLSMLVLSGCSLFGGGDENSPENIVSRYHDSLTQDALYSEIFSIDTYAFGVYTQITFDSIENIKKEVTDVAIERVNDRKIKLTKAEMPELGPNYGYLIYENGAWRLDKVSALYETINDIEVELLVTLLNDFKQDKTPFVSDVQDALKACEGKDDIDSCVFGKFHQPV